MLRFSPNGNLAHLINWFEWEEAAFRKAREQDKPVMLFLGAFWCRYCQRMDEGAFSDRENMALLNAYFVAFRVENATRPDIDARYNLNGWPTIAFFTPSGEMLAAANYLPVDQFKDLLLNVYLHYQQKTAAERLAQSAPASEIPVAVESAAKRPHRAVFEEIKSSIMKQVDGVHGGFGSGQKFIHPAANDFLLACYARTGDANSLEHVCRTLDRMREGQIHDAKEGGYFRTTSGADWSQPHREKLLAEQAGLLSNCVRAFRLTQRRQYAGMAEEIIAYLDQKLFDLERGAFFGCEDFLRHETGGQSSTNEFFSIIDDCIYTDANAQAAGAYLEAAACLERADCRERALAVLEFLWGHCRAATGSLFHYHDGAGRLLGLLDDQAQMGLALVLAHGATGDAKHLERAKETAEFIIAQLRNPAGGYFDLMPGQFSLGKFPLTDIDQNGAAARFFLMLAEATDDPRYRESARWALDAFGGDFAAHGIHVSRFGCALLEYLSRS